MISVTCSGCGKGLRVKDELAGRKGKCPKCGKVVPIPAAKPAVADFVPLDEAIEANDPAENPVDDAVRDHDAPPVADNPPFDFPKSQFPKSAHRKGQTGRKPGAGGSQGKIVAAIAVGVMALLGVTLWLTGFFGGDEHETAVAADDSDHENDGDETGTDNDTASSSTLDDVPPFTGDEDDELPANGPSDTASMQNVDDSEDPLLTASEQTTGGDADLAQGAATSSAPHWTRVILDSGLISDEEDAQYTMLAELQADLSGSGPEDDIIVRVTSAVPHPIQDIVNAAGEPDEKKEGETHLEEVVEYVYGPLGVGVDPETNQVVSLRAPRDWWLTGLRNTARLADQSNNMTLVPADGSANTDSAVVPDGPLEITDVVIRPDGRNGYSLAITLRNPIPSSVLNQSTLRILCLSTGATISCEGATDVHFREAEFTAGVPFSWMAGPVVDGEGVPQGFAVDLTVNQSHWPTTTPRTIELAVNDDGVSWGAELVHWLAATRKGEIHVALSAIPQPTALCPRLKPWWKEAGCRATCNCRRTCGAIRAWTSTPRAHF